MSDKRPKVRLILEHSEDPSIQVGVVKDCQGSVPLDASSCDATGTWSKLGRGTFFVELTTSVEALQDVLIQLISERAKFPGLATYPVIHRSDIPSEPTRRLQRSKPTNDVPSTDFGNLRTRLGK